MSRVLSIFNVTLLLFCLLPVPASALDILALPMVIDPELDAWHHVPASSEPSLNPTQRVYRGQPFRLLVIAKDYTTDNLHNANITYSVQGFDPNGAPLFKQKTILELFEGPVSSNNFLLLSRQFLTLDFSTTDPVGTYRFEFTAHDALAETISSSTATILLPRFADRDAFGSVEEFSIWLSNYYRAPDPARAITALLQYVDPESPSSHKQAPLLTFFSHVIQDNPFLWPHLKSIYSESDTINRKKILLLSALSGQADEPFFSSLDLQLLEFYRNAQKISLLKTSDRPALKVEIDTLWAEFMATGTIAPIRKLIGALHLEPTKGAQEKIESGAAEMTPQLKANAALESVYQTALVSLINNGYRHSLVKQYLGYIYDLEEPEPVIKAQLKDILAIIQKRSNEEDARKHLEQQNQQK